MDLVGFGPARLRAEGFQILSGFFDVAEREDLARRGREVGDKVRSGELTRRDQFCLGLPDSWFEDLIHHPRLLAYVQSVLGPDLCVGTWRVVMKDAKHFSGPIGVHQDWPYFGGNTNKLNIFIPITPMNRANGAMVFHRGSHLMGPVERGDIDASRYPDLPEVCAEVEVGDVLAADFLTWHYSPPASTPSDRILVQMVFLPASDPSTKHLLTGEIRNPHYCPDRFAPMRLPMTHLNSQTARAYFEQGDLDKAERFARGVLASDEDHGAAALLLYDILKAKGSDEAEQYLQKAREASASLAAALAARAPPAASSEDDLEPARPKAEMALEATRASLGGRITRGLRALRRVSR
jgi:hypothetical protein